MLKSFVACRFALAAFAAAVLGLFAAHPTWAKSLGLDVWDVPTMGEELRAGAEADRKLSDQSTEVRRRIVVKDAIIADLLARRITLVEATEQFTALNASRPEYLEIIRLAYPGETDQEKFARNVIAFAHMRAAPDRRADLDARLERELQDMTGALAAE